MAKQKPDDKAADSAGEAAAKAAHDDVAAVLLEMMRKMAQASGADAKDVDVVRLKDVKQIVVPVGMPLKKAINWLSKKDAAEEKSVNILFSFDCFPLDGAVAMQDALGEIYGFVEKADTPGFFGPTPPLMIGVPTGPATQRQVPWGSFGLPGIEGKLQTGWSWSQNRPQFTLHGTVKQRHMGEIDLIVEAIKRRLATHSIYKGKAVSLDLQWKRDEDDFSPLDHAPRFDVPLEGADESALVLPTGVEHDVRVGLFTPIDRAAFCRRVGVPARRGVLMYGDYGTGKTLCSWICAKKAVDAGMTFIYVKSVLDLARAFEFAKLYQPAVVFAEDLDVVVSGPQSDEMQQLRNAFDGIGGKTAEIITILTTNHLDKLDPALLRPGRCDLLVKIDRPDAEAAARLVKLYGKSLIAKGADYASIGRMLAGHLPAEIREAVERSKMACIERLARDEVDTADIAGQVTEADIAQAVRAMDVQHKLLQPKAGDKRSALEKFGQAIGREIGESISAFYGAAGCDNTNHVLAGVVSEALENSASANGD